MNLYLLPLERIGYARVPRYLTSRFISGLDYAWSLKDFGQSSEIALVAMEEELEAHDVLKIPVTWSRADRGRVTGYLRSAGIEPDWVDGAQDWRDAWQRIAGLTQAYQSASDNPDNTPDSTDPSKWNGRDLRFGNFVLPPTDLDAYRTEQKLLRDAKKIRLGDWVLEGREWVNEKTGARLPVIQGAALPATDSFTDSDYTSLTSHGNWVENTGTGDFQIYSNNCASSGGGEEMVHWSSDTFDDDQYAEITITSLANNVGIGVATRVATSAVTGYGYYGSANNGTYLFKNISGSWTQLGSTGSVWSVSDVVRLESSGTTQTPKVNGTAADIGAQTDSSISSGYSGISGWHGSTSSRGDNWEGGDLGSAPVEITVQDGSSTTQADNVVTTKSDTLVPADGFSITQADNVITTKSDTLTVADGFATTQADSITVSQAVNITVQSVYSETQSDNVTLTGVHNLTVTDGYSEVQADNVSLATIGNLVVQNSYSETQADNVAITKSDTLAVDNVYSETQADSVTTTKSDTLIVSDAYSETQADNVSLTSDGDLVVQNGYSETQSDSIILTYSTTLAVANVYSVTQSDNVSLTSVHNLSVSDGYFVTVADVVTLSGDNTPTVKTWTLQDRDLTWTLEDRDLTWTLRDRDLTWTVDER